MMSVRLRQHAVVLALDELHAVRVEGNEVYSATGAGGTNNQCGSELVLQVSDLPLERCASSL
jgi:hypothetical protein